MKTTKEIKEDRIKGYFIDAMKETLKGEGLKAVNVRSIAERAGYSYATLYNYFKDLNELVFLCVKDFTSECESFVDEKSKKYPLGKERIKVRMQGYINYFIQYPGIFELMFVEGMRDLGTSQPIALHIYTFIDKLIEHDIDTLIANNHLSPEEATILTFNLKNSITGLLLFYNHRMQPADYKELIAASNHQLDAILTVIK